jgi:hypothetical protein
MASRSLGDRLLLSGGTTGGFPRLDREAVLQGVEQAVERLIRQGSILVLFDASQGNCLIAIAGLRCDLWTKPRKRLELPAPGTAVELYRHEVQVPRPVELVDEGVTIADSEPCAGVIDLAGTDIKQRMGVPHRHLGLFLCLTVRTRRPEDQQTPVLLEPNPGTAVPLFREETFDLTQSAPFSLDEAGQGRSEEKSAANGHETLKTKEFEEGYHSYMADKGRGNPERRKVVSVQPPAPEFSWRSFRCVRYWRL